MRSLALATAVLLGATASAQEELPEGEERPFGGCFEAGARLHGTLHGSLDGPRVPVPSGSTQAASSASTPLSGIGGGGGGEGLLVLAVVAAVALPIIVYAIDAPADPRIQRQYECPSLRLEVWSGGMSTPSAEWRPLAGARPSFAIGALGFDASIESTFDPRLYGAADAHLLLRPPPRRHIEGALALGFRRVVFGGAERNGFEAALPHRYVLARVDAAPIAIELHPAIFIGNRGLDARIDAGMTFPVGPLSMQVGARVFSFDDHVRAGAYLGLGIGG